MELVPHLDGPGSNGFEIEPAHFVQRRSQHRREVGFHPVEPLYDLLPVGTEPEHFAPALVEVRVGDVALDFVLDDGHRHRRRDDAGHRADGLVVVTGGELDLAGGRQFSRRLGRLGPSLVHGGTHHRTPLGTGHVVPRHRRTRVQ
jgi:hypothetical protein